jgi:EAL domain-containing protein (putative c-di-GMP-specific phosphodiesterase class I)/CheY-like chemotaxis protein
MGDVSKLRVLLVDDDPVAIEVGLAALQELGVAATNPALSAHEALALFDATPDFGLVVCDVDMPGMDGIAFLRHLEQRQYRGAMLIVSGTHQKLLRIAKEAASARTRAEVDTLEKPLQIKQLAAIVEKAVRSMNRSPVATSSDASFDPDDLLRAVERNQLLLEYQPKVVLATGAPVGCEALVRWQHPTHGLVSPAVFIPLAEREGLISSITRWVVDRAIQQMAAWRSEHLHVSVAINLSMCDLQDLDWPDRITATVRSLHLTPQQITFELTESQNHQDLADALEILTRLRLRGFGLALDDFGTGFSSLQKLATLPFTELKIDRSFVRNAVNDEGAKKIMQAGAELAKTYGMTSVAEGIETPQELALAHECGCDCGQGYLFSKALHAEPFAQWFRAQGRGRGGRASPVRLRAN